MNDILTILKKRASVLRNAISKAEHETRFPEGRLRVSSNGNRTRYYLVTEEHDTQGEYITKENRTLAKQLAQRDYNRQFLRTSHEELKRIEQLVKFLSIRNAESVYEILSPGRRNLVTPYIIPDDIYVKEWQSQDYISNQYMTEKLIYDTRNGEKVRSKSEAIIADILYELGIPYHYEKPLYLSKRVVRYPDFTILDISTREEVYLEHFGLLDNEEYLGASLNKFDEYRKYGVYPGKNLIFTYETQDNPLDIKGIRKMLKELFDTPAKRSLG